MIDIEQAKNLHTWNVATPKVITFAFEAGIDTEMVISSLALAVETLATRSVDEDRDRGVVGGDAVSGEHAIDAGFNRGIGRGGLGRQLGARCGPRPQAPCRRSSPGRWQSCPI